MKRNKYEKILKVKTEEDRFALLPSSLHYNLYEPTNYEALETLVREYQMDETAHIVDFGCGKGRLNFFLNFYTGATVKGIEMDEHFIEDALVNLEQYAKKYPKDAENIEFFTCLAEEYIVTDKDNIFYFFNPFSVQIFQKVVFRILDSHAASPRSMDIILFYAHEDYIFFLEEQTPFELFQEIQVGRFYEKDKNERFLIYRLSHTLDIPSYK